MRLNSCYKFSISLFKTSLSFFRFLRLSTIEWKGGGGGRREGRVDTMLQNFLVYADVTLAIAGTVLRSNNYPNCG